MRPRGFIAQPSQASAPFEQHRAIDGEIWLAPRTGRKGSANNWRECGAKRGGAGAATKIANPWPPPQRLRPHTNLCAKASSHTSVVLRAS